MKNILERFEKLAAAHGLSADCMASMRGLLQDAHSAGYLQHERVIDDIDADEQDSLPGGATARDEDEPDDEKEEEATERMVKSLRKEIRKTLKKEVRKAVHKLHRIAPVAQ